MHLFLYGNLAKNFEEVSAPFVAAAGGKNARIALLHAGGRWENHFHRYRDPWLRLGAAEVIPVGPAGEALTLSVNDLEVMRTCTGIFMGGGHTRNYHELYATGEAAAIIRERCVGGVPYGGTSAGALIAPATSLIWGDTVDGHFVGGSEHGCNEPLRVGAGLGLVQDLLLEAHFNDLGGFTRLVAAMQQTEAVTGLGIDDSVCVEMQPDMTVAVHGQGHAYLLRRTAGDKVEVQMLQSGSRFRL